MSGYRNPGYPFSVYVAQCFTRATQVAKQSVIGAGLLLRMTPAPPNRVSANIQALCLAVQGRYFVVQHFGYGEFDASARDPEGDVRFGAQ